MRVKLFIVKLLGFNMGNNIILNFKNILNKILIIFYILKLLYAKW